MFVARQRPPQPGFCSRPPCSPGHRSSCSLSSLSRCCTPPWRPPCGRGRRSRASPGRGPSSGANSASRPKISAPAAGRERSWRPPDGAVGTIVCGFLTEFGGTFQGYGAGGQVENGRIFLLQKWIDLDELNPMVWVPSIVRRRIDFSLAVFELGAPRALHPYAQVRRRPPLWQSLALARRLRLSRQSKTPPP